MVSVCLPSDALLQHLPSFLGFSYLGRGVSLHGCSSKAQLLLLTLDKGYLLNHKLPDVQARFRKVRGTRDQIANIHWITEKARECQKNVYFCFVDYANAFDHMDQNKL